MQNLNVKLLCKPLEIHRLSILSLFYSVIRLTMITRVDHMNGDKFWQCSVFAAVYMLFVFLLGTLAVLLTGISLFLYHSPKVFSNTPTCDNGPVPDMDTPPNSDPELTKSKMEKHEVDFKDTKLPSLEEHLGMAMDWKRNSRLFDRVCFVIIFSLTLTSILCLLVLLTSRDLEIDSYINSAHM